MQQLSYFYRHPHAIYFSIEKIFRRIAHQVSSLNPPEFSVREYELPFASKLTTISRNISFARQKQTRINHVTGDAHYIILGFSKSNINILTVHDCVILHRYPQYDPRHWVLKWLWYDLPIKKADAITVISENTKRELLKFTGCRPEKIRVIPDFVDPVFQPHPYPFHQELPRILFIGTTPNKNLELFIEAIKGLPVHLDIVGPLHPGQMDRLTTHGIRYSQSEGLPEEALVEKYIQCDLLAFPSTYEGFGLPVIEAQAIGRPVLTSNLSPMREVAGAGACLVDPHHAASMRQGLEKILKDSGYRKQLIEDGFLNVKRFGLKEIANQYLSLYKDLSSKKIMQSE